MLEASIAPSAAPAPTIVCSSSMKMMISALEAPDLLHHALHALLELAAILRARHETREVERHDAPIPQRRGDVVVGDALRKTLGDGGLADAGVADQARVVLRAAAEDLDDPLELLARDRPSDRASPSRASWSDRG
jgi:hypothetical protein